MEKNKRYLDSIALMETLHHILGSDDLSEAKQFAREAIKKFNPDTQIIVPKSLIKFKHTLNKKDSTMGQFEIYDVTTYLNVKHRRMDNMYVCDFMNDKEGYKKFNKKIAEDEILKALTKGELNNL